MAEFFTNLKQLKSIFCSHFTVPYIPDLAGSETYPKQMIHTHYYRNPKTFEDKTVFILGAGYSGTDIALDMSPLANKVLHCDVALVFPLLHQ